MTETERELGLQLGDAHAEIRLLNAQINQDDTVEAWRGFAIQADIRTRAALAEIETLKEERDNALRASRYTSDLCQQALADLKPYLAEIELLKAKHLIMLKSEEGLVKRWDALEAAAQQAIDFLSCLHVKPDKLWESKLWESINCVANLNAAIAQQKETK